MQRVAIILVRREERCENRRAHLFLLALLGPGAAPLDGHVCSGHYYGLLWYGLVWYGLVGPCHLPRHQLDGRSGKPRNVPGHFDPLLLCYNSSLYRRPHDWYDGALQRASR